MEMIETLSLVQMSHLSHTCLLALPLLGLAGLQREAFSVDSVTGWLVSLSRDP